MQLFWKKEHRFLKGNNLLDGGKRMDTYIKRAAVIGSGVMGAGIAALMAGVGIETFLLDMIPTELTPQESQNGLTLDHPMVRNRFANAGKEKVLKDPMGIYDQKFATFLIPGNLEDDLHKLADCDLIIEAIIENMTIKQDLMVKLSKHINDHAIVASNTSGLPIGEIGSKSQPDFRKRFLGAHFFNPPRFMRLLELIPTSDTDPYIIEKSRLFFEQRLGKNVIIAKDTPGFIGNRIGIHAYGVVLQAADKYHYGVQKIDQLTGKVLGRANSATFRTMDLVGVDLVKRVSDIQTPKLKDEVEKTEQELPAFFHEVVAKGFWGNKAGKGFYYKQQSAEGISRFAYNIFSGDYEPLAEEGLPVPEQIKKAGQAGLAALVYGEADENRFAWEITKKMLINCAKRIPEISDDYKQVDTAMKDGFNWQLGPFELWDEIGLGKSVEKMKSEGDSLPAWAETMAAEGKSFYVKGGYAFPYILPTEGRYPLVMQNEEAMVKDIGDGVLSLVFTSKANSLTNNVSDMIVKAIDKIENEDYKGLVIKNYGPNFSVGGNLNLILEASKAKNWDMLGDSIEKLQECFMRLKYSKKPVVAAPHGMTLGGGTELVLQSPHAVAHVETYMGLVEAGVGLIPAGGGTKEMLFRAMKGLLNIPLVEAVNRLYPAFESIAMGKVSSNAHDARNKSFLRDTDRIVMNIDYQVNAAKSELIHLFDSGFMPQIPYDVPATGIDGKAAFKAKIEFLRSGGYISDYDAYIAEKIAGILTGGNIWNGAVVSEKYILQLEKEAFLSLCGEEKTQERIAYMLKTGKPLRN